MKAIWDRKYLELCKKILDEGIEVENRTGINTIKIPGYFFELDLEEEFPVLMSKQLFFKNAITEMLWIYQAQSNDVRWLQERNNHIWDEWQIDEDGLWKANQMLPNEEGKLELKEVVRQFPKEYKYTIGTAYGYITNKFQMTQNLIKGIKENPNDRRKVMSLWQDDYLKTAVLPSCVWSSEWDVTDGKINIWVHQRSCDVALGLPFNVTQYAVLLSMIAHVTGYKPGKIFWSIKDAHIYVNQIEGIKEQLSRIDALEELVNSDDFIAPSLWLNEEVKDFFEFDNTKELKDIKIINYKHLGKIEFPIAQ